MQKFCWSLAFTAAGLLLVPLVSIGWDEGTGEPDRKDPQPRRAEGRQDPPPRGERAPQPRREGDRPAIRASEGPMPPLRGDRPPPRGDGEGPYRPMLPRGEGRPLRGPGDRDPMGREGLPLGPPPERMEQLREDDPEMFELVSKDMELERRSHDLSRRVRNVPKEGQAKGREELTKIAAEQFAVRQQRRELHLKRLEEELKELKAALQKRTDQKQEIIDRRVNELLGRPRDEDF